MQNNCVKIKNNAKTGQIFSFFDTLEKVFLGISERPKGIIKERFGINDGKQKTLEEIGKKYGITRERVRQIIKETIKKAKKNKIDAIENAKCEIKFTIENKNGIINEEILFGKKYDPKEKGSLMFFLEIFDEINLKEIPGELEKSWTTEKFNISEWRELKNAIKEILEKEKSLLHDQDIFRKISQKTGFQTDKQKIFDYLDVSSEIRKGNFGKWGLHKWAEINPKGTREKIYLILKETGSPLHFREIASLIDKHGLNKKKKTHPQTVHNELIRDERFVLVGRGIYALSEWGYHKGTVKDVIEDYLLKKGYSAKKDDVINHILNLRKVKKSTILINLNNYFQKVGKDNYAIKVKK